MNKIEPLTDEELAAMPDVGPAFKTIEEWEGMTMTTMTLTAQAKELGGNSADAYFDEFGISPANDGATKVGDWDTAAWQCHWHELKNAGATVADYAACFMSWREGFWA